MFPDINLYTIELQKYKPCKTLQNNDLFLQEGH